MDATSIILIIAGVIAAYLLIKIISPILRIALSLLIFLVLFYILQNFFGFDFSPVYKPVMKYFSIGAMNGLIRWFGNLLNSYITRGISFFQYLIGNLPQ